MLNGGVVVPVGSVVVVLVIFVTAVVLSGFEEKFAMVISRTHDSSQAV